MNFETMNFETMTYQTVQGFAQTWGLVLLVIFFAAALIFALWPGNKTRFEAAARLPLEDESAEPDSQDEGKGARP